MGSLFDQDRAFWRFINKATDLVILNVMFVLCCLPIITIGPAYTALYYTIMKTVRKGRGYLFKNFLHSFKQNFVQGSTIWMIMLIIASLLGMTIISLWDSATSGGIAQFGLWTAIIIAFFLVLLFIYIFPVLSRFEFKLGNLFAFSYLIAVRYFAHSVLLAIILAATVLGCVLSIPLFVIILPAAYIYIASTIIEKIFAVYMPKFEAPQDASPEHTDGELWVSGDEADAKGSEGKAESEEKPYKDQWYYE